MERCSGWWRLRQCLRFLGKGPGRGVVSSEGEREEVKGRGLGRSEMYRG